MKRIFITLLAMTSIATSVAAQTPVSDSLRTQSKTQLLLRALDEQHAPDRWMLSVLHINPATHATAYALDYSQAGAGFRMQRNDEAQRLALGEGNTFGFFAAESFRRLSERSSVWGKAGYRRGSLRNVVWNSSADYELIYPYVTADSVGGNLTSEEYTFSGGYGHQNHKWRWALEADIRASHEYRDIDPRPRNISTMLEFRGGATLRTGKYEAGLSLAAKIYKQRGDVDYYNPQGIKAEYHLSGLGAHYARFSGSDAGSLYRGGGCTLAATFSPHAGEDGLFAVASYEYLSIEKILIAFNNLPLQTVAPHDMQATLGWTSIRNRMKWGGNAHLQYTYRPGTESIVGEKISNIYAVVGELKMYEGSTLRTRIEGFLNKTDDRLEWSVSPWTLYEKMTEDYLYPVQNRESEQFSGGANASLTIKRPKMHLRMDAGLGYRTILSHNLLLPVADLHPSILRMVRHDYRRMTLDALLCHLDLRTDHALNRKLNLFVEVGGRLNRFSDSTTGWGVYLQTGITF